MFDGQRLLVDDGGAGLPPGAIAYADFKNGTYYYGGNALSDFLVENLDWGAGSFSPTPGEGLVTPPNTTTGPALAAPLSATLLASGFTMVIDWLAVEEVVSQIFVAVADVPAYANYWDSTFNHDSTDPESRCFINLPSGSNEFPDMGPGERRIAVRWAGTGVHYSINGGAVVGVDEVLDFSPLNLIGFSCTGGTWSRLVCYPPKTNAELAALSAG